ncbi:MAG: signal peptidase II [Clostridia bacterium]|nr:signal peptidase II [Clostridia bacterium]
MFFIVLAIIATAVLALDFVSKYLSVTLEFNFVVIPNVLKFIQTYNTGAAFGMLGDKAWAKYLFIVFTILACLFIIAYFVFNIVKKRRISKWLGVALTLIFSGAIGNLYDRIFLGKVRDFILFFYNTRIFPYIFNVADSALVIGVIMVIVYLLFLEKDAVFKRKDKQDGN